MNDQIQHNSEQYQAVQDFRRSRLQADMEIIIARFRGASPDLLSFDEVRQKLNIPASGKQVLKEIPLDAIVGSVGRYSDFTRHFFPKNDSDVSRWTGVLNAINGAIGTPPIDVYQIDRVYFVRDGNHRVSVARRLKMKTIHAYVTMLSTKISLTPDMTTDDLILKAEYSAFLQETRIDELRPGADLQLTAHLAYKELYEHISVHRYYMGLEQKREIPYEEAVTHWYDTVYMPVVQAIRERGILRQFPGRTEADMYLWVSIHHSDLQKALGTGVHPATTVVEYSARRLPKLGQILTQTGRNILEALIPDQLEGGPKTGQWRRELLAARADDRLFNDLLVPISGGEGGWFALEHAIAVAGRENGCIHGLHVTPTPEEADGENALALESRFTGRCRETGIPVDFIRTAGEIAPLICERARWTDLIVVNVTYPPAADPISRLGSGFHTIIRRCSRPILAVPSIKEGDPYAVSEMKHGLLAYGGSPKSEEALFVAAYLVCHWHLKLDVLMIGSENSVILPPEEGVTDADSPGGMPLTLEERARSYLEKCTLDTVYIHSRRTGVEGEIGADELIAQTARERGCDLIIMGGYEAAPVIEVFVGSTVDGVLRQTSLPVLICR